MALVCLCYGVSDRRIRREIGRGATSIDDLAVTCGAGSCCQGCHPTLDDLLCETVCAVRPTSRRLGAA